LKNYGIYTIDGEKLSDSEEILQSLWGGITKSVLDRIANNMFGILLHRIYINGKIHWIVRESKKWNIKEAKNWVPDYLIKNPNGDRRRKCG
jgi:hypothetical protein